MGAIKDIIDLVTQLANSVEGRKLANELNHIQTLILSIQSEHAELHEKNIHLREEGLDFKGRILELEGQIRELSSASTHAISQEPSCPNCSTNSTPFYMSPIGRRLQSVAGGTHRCSKCEYVTAHKR